MGPERFASIEAEPVTVTKPTKVTGPVTLTLRLSQPTDLGERYAELTISEDVLNHEIVGRGDVLLTAYNRLQELLSTE